MIYLWRPIPQKHTHSFTETKYFLSYKYIILFLIERFTFILWNWYLENDIKNSKRQTKNLGPYVYT